MFLIQSDRESGQEPRNKPPAREVPYEYAFSRFMRYMRWSLHELWELPDDYVEQEYMFYTLEAKYGLLDSSF